MVASVFAKLTVVDDIFVFPSGNGRDSKDRNPQTTIRCECLPRRTHSAIDMFALLGVLCRYLGSVKMVVR
jgi:hypothetical protein